MCKIHKLYLYTSMLPSLYLAKKKSTHISIMRKVSSEREDFLSFFCRTKISIFLFNEKKMS